MGPGPQIISFCYYPIMLFCCYSIMLRTSAIGRTWDNGLRPLSKNNIHAPNARQVATPISISVVLLLLCLCCFAFIQLCCFAIIQLCCFCYYSIILFCYYSIMLFCCYSIMLRTSAIGRTWDNGLRPLSKNTSMHVPRRKVGRAH